MFYFLPCRKHIDFQNELLYKKVRADDGVPPSEETLVQEYKNDSSRICPICRSCELQQFAASCGCGQDKNSSRHVQERGTAHSRSGAKKLIRHLPFGLST
jgi:hypothetical protein